jgi:hypothetical protein
LCTLVLAPILSANDDGEITEASIVLTISPDFRVKEEVSITKRLLSYQALDTDGDPRTPYCGDLQTLTITKARVTTPGGKVVDCTPNALNLSTPDELVAHPALAGWQEMVVTFLGLEPGSKTELGYIREDKKAFRTAFEKKQVLAWHFPIRKGTVRVRLPKDMKLAYQIMNFQGEASANPGAEFMEYAFTFKDIPGYSDRDMHDSTAFLPTLYLTTTASWRAAGKHLQAIAEKYGAPDEAITKKTQELTKDTATDLDKAVAIHKYVKAHFKEIEWPLQDSLMLLNEAAKTFQTGQGTNMELALLVRAMMNAAGLRADLVLTGPPPSVEGAPGFMAFDRTAVLASAGQAILIEPAGTLGSMDGDRCIIGEGWGDGGPLEAYPGGVGNASASRSMVLTGEVEIKDNEVLGLAVISLSGPMNPYWRNLEESGALEEAVKAFLLFPGLKADEVAPKALGPEQTRLEVKFSGKLREGDRVVRLLPEAKALLPDLDLRGAATALPVHLPEVKASIRWAVKGAGRGEAMELKPASKGGEITISRKPGEDGFTLAASMVLGGGTLLPADYPAFRAALAAWQNPVVAGVMVP